MEYQATIDVAHRQEVRQLVWAKGRWWEKARAFGTVASYSFTALLLVTSMLRLSEKTFLAWHQGRLDAGLELLQSSGLEPLLWSLILLIPLALLIIYWSLRVVSYELLPFVVLPGVRRRMRRQRLTGEHRYDIQSIAVNCHDGVTTDVILWSKVKEIVETRLSFLLMTKDGMYYIVPKPTQTNKKLTGRLGRALRDAFDAGSRGSTPR